MKKYGVIDYIFLLLLLVFTVFFTNHVNQNIENGLVKRVYPASIVIEVKDDLYILNSIKSGLRLSEDKQYLNSYVEEVSISEADTASVCIIEVKAELEKKNGQYYLNSKSIEIGKEFMFETEFHYLKAVILDLDVGESYEK